jgi:sugar phosphate isomerase/epimerase
MNEIGVFTSCLRIPDPGRAIAAVRTLGMSVLQVGRLASEWYSENGARQYRDLLDKNGVTANACVIVHQGESYRDIAAVERTVGYLPQVTCVERVEHSHDVVDFAAGIGASIVTTHIGFLPERVQHDSYVRLLRAVQEIGQHCGRRGLTFALETGQETAGELAEFIDRVGLDNVAVNFDGANFVVYDIDDPLAAVDVLRDRIVGVHVKDGKPPQEEWKLGPELLLGEGEAQPCAWVRSIVSGGYAGPLILELYAGDDSIQALRRGKAYLEACLAESP